MNFVKTFKIDLLRYIYYVIKKNKERIIYTISNILL